MSGAGGTSTVTVEGDVIMNGGTLTTGGAGTTENFTVNGNMNVTAGTISSTGSNTLLNLTVNGGYTMSGGTGTTTGASSKIYLNEHGSYAMTGGSWVSASSSSVVLLNLYGDCSYSGACAMTATGAGSNSNVHLMLPSASGTMMVNNTSTGTWSKTNVYIDAGCTAQLDGDFSTTTGAAAYGLMVNGTLICPAAYFVNGTRVFSLNPSATLKVAHVGGVNSAIITTGTTTFSTDANYEFNGTAAQVTGTYLPASLVSPSVLTINNTAGVTLTQTTATTGSLNFLAGILHTAAFTMTTPCAASGVTGAGSLNYVHGTLIKPISGCTSINYQVGNVNYAPMSLALSAAGTAGSIGLKVTNGLHPSVGSSGLSTTAMTNHYWTVTNLSAAGPIAIIPTATYNSTDIIGGSNASFKTQEYVGAAWLPSAVASTNTSSPYTSTPTSGITLASVAGDYIFGDLPCGTLPITGTPTVCISATTTLNCATPGGTWNSASPTIATVSGGVVSGVAAGTAVISYTASGCTVTQVVTVFGAPDPGTITGVTSACIGFTTTLNSTVTGGTWSSGTPGVGTVSTSGVVTGITAGSTNITYTVTGPCGTATATVSVTVGTSLTVAPIIGADSVCVSQTITLTDATGGGIWSSFNTALATVSSSGVVIGVAVGIDTIYYTVTNSCGTAKAKKTVKVVPAGTCPTTGIYVNTAEETPGINIYPNPNAGDFTIALTGMNETVRITITDVTGRVVAELQMQPNTKREVRLYQPAGLYIISASTATERYFARVRLE